MNLDRTFVMVKPDGIQRGLLGEVIRRIECKGFKIAAMKMTVLTHEKAQAHYAEHIGKPFFGDLVGFITSGPSVSMVVEGKGAISAMRKINGSTNPADAKPGTIRGDLAIETARNVVHASDSPQSAEREISLHFNADEIVDYSRIDEAWLYE